MAPLQFLRLRDVQARTGLARATIYLRISQGRFPKPVPLGSPHAVGWIASEIDEWTQAQISAARGPVRESALATTTAA